jgi:hypothetical protein
MHPHIFTRRILRPTSHLTKQTHHIYLDGFITQRLTQHPSQRNQLFALRDIPALRMIQG